LPFVSVGSEERNVRYKWDFAWASGSTCHSPVKGGGDASKKTNMTFVFPIQIRRQAVRRNASGLTP
jgi:hypothetical protein